MLIDFNLQPHFLQKKNEKKLGFHVGTFCSDELLVLLCFYNEEEGNRKGSLVFMLQEYCSLLVPFNPSTSAVNIIQFYFETNSFILFSF